jgi:hypothetical protein
VFAVNVNLEREWATVDYDPGALPVPKMLEAIQRSVILSRFRRTVERVARGRRGRRAR